MCHQCRQQADNVVFRMRCTSTACYVVLGELQYWYIFYSIPTHDIGAREPQPAGEPPRPAAQSDGCGPYFYASAGHGQDGGYLSRLRPAAARELRRSECWIVYHTYKKYQEPCTSARSPVLE